MTTPTPQPLRVTMTGIPFQAYMGSPGVSGMVYNFDTTNTIYVGYTPNIAIGAPNTQIFPPGFGMTMDLSKTLYAIGSANSGPLQITPGGGSPFLQLTLSSLGGAQIFVQATAPAPPPTIPLNSLWLNTTLGALEVWNGSSWAVTAFTGTELITAGTIAANLLIAGIVVAGIVNSTEIDGAIFRAKNASGATVMTINKTSATWIQYQDTGSATQGMVIASATNATATTTDEFSNEILEGLTLYSGTSGAWNAISFAAGNAISYYTSTASTQIAFVLESSISFNSVGRGVITDPTTLVRNITRSTSQATGQTAGNTTVAQALFAGVFHTSTDFAAGDEFEIAMPFNVQLGQTTAETFTIGYQLDGGSVVNLITVGAAIVALAAKYSGWLRFKGKVITVGTSGTGSCQFWLEGGVQAAANVLFTNGAAIAGTVLPAVNFDTTVVHTFQLVGQWGGAGGSDQSFVSLGATYTEY